jgi:inner membrane protein
VASFGHLAVGLLAGRLQDDGRAARGRPRSQAATMIGFSLLAMLPDADVFIAPLGLGPHNSIVTGHRGASHSLLMALAVAVAGGLLARRYGWNGVRTMLAVMLAIGSHGLLDTLGQGGRPIPLLWPLTEQRFRSPWLFLPDAPRGLKFISRHGLLDAVLEFIYFLPVTIFALWPRASARMPRLAVVGGGASEPVPRPLAAAAPSAPAATENTGDLDLEPEEPSLRSIG